MRRRLTASMLGLVFVALLISGAVSLGVAQHEAAQQTRKELVREASGLATTFRDEADTRANPAAALRTLLSLLRPPLRLDGAAVLAIHPATGTLFDPLNPLQAPVLPKGLSLADLPVSELSQLKTISGQHGSLVYAAVPYEASITLARRPRTVTQVVVVTRQSPSEFGTAGAWAGATGIVVLLLAAGVAHRLGARFAAPVEAAEKVARGVAAGDLGGRVVLRRDADPELAALARSINDMAAGLQTARDSERHFLQSISHDLRTPLTSIRGFAEAIEDGATAEPASAAAVIASEARRLERLVGDVLALATLDARRFTLHPALVDLNAEVAAAATAFLPAAASLGLTLRMADQRELPAFADPDRLAQVVANLVENALRYAASEVTLTTGDARGCPWFAVTDDGAGIGAQRLPHVFERLYESRPRPDRPIGSGLGLTIVAELVAAMGGTVQVQSPAPGLGSGSRFVVYLPAAPGQTNGSAANLPPSTGSGSDPSTPPSTVA